MYVSDISLHKIPLVVKCDLDTGGNMKNHHDTLMSFGENSKECFLRNPDGDKDVAYILYDMLTKSQVHKENGEHVHEYVEVDITIVDDGVVNNHDHSF
ncbi:unnamed protein product [Vicia faba]|uniref:Uncharacterized protein n=1 Tax=Vicia faba TaxID=3906 RepID=A0AAV0YHA7_VICFA|nr:unnamed protein product [Vicia faba]